MPRGIPPMQPPPPGTARFPGQPNSETVGPNHPVFHPAGNIDDPSGSDPTNTIPPGSVPPGASFDPINPPVSGLNRFAGPNNDDDITPPE